MIVEKDTSCIANAHTHMHIVLPLLFLAVGKLSSNVIYYLISHGGAADKTSKNVGVQTLTPGVSHWMFLSASVQSADRRGGVHVSSAGAPRFSRYHAARMTLNESIKTGGTHLCVIFKISLAIQKNSRSTSSSRDTECCAVSLQICIFWLSCLY